MKRRNFLSLAGGAIAGTTGLEYNPGIQTNTIFDLFKLETNKVLVLIQLDGGNDGLNTLIPLDQMDLYTKSRTSVALAENKVLKINSTNKTGFHPAMDALRGLYNEGRIKWIQSVGYPNPNFSHFRSTDIWMSGSDSEEILNTGWIGRYLQNEYPNYPNGFPTREMPDPLSVEIGYGQTLAFQSSTTSTSVTIADPDSFNKILQGLEPPVPNTLYGSKVKYLRLIKSQANVYGEQMKQASLKVKNKANYPTDNNLAEQLKIVARLIAGGLRSRVYKVTIGGFDTHDNQVMESDHTQGEHANLWNKISSAIKAFLDDATALGFQDRMIGMTVSEFGRRIRSNASRGTDHGAAAPLMLFGNGIAGGILGSNPILPKEPTFEDNIPMQYDFRSIYGTVLQDWFCVSKSEVEKTLGKSYQSLPLILPSFSCLSTPTREETALMGNRLMNIYPNPFESKTTIELKSSVAPSYVTAFSANGKIIKQLLNSNKSESKQTIIWNADDLPSGNYYIRCQQGGLQQVLPVTKIK